MAEKILIISPVPLFPGYAGNRERIRTVCSELMDRGYRLDFFYTGYDDHLHESHNSFFNGEVLKYRLEKKSLNIFHHLFKRAGEIVHGFRVRMHKWFRNFVDGSDSARFNRSLHEYKNSGKQLLLKKQIANRFYKAVILNYAPYSFYFDLFDNSTIRIIDTHDCLTDRYKLFLENNRQPIKWHSLRYEDEKRAFSKADILWAITDEESRQFKKMVDPERIKIYTLRHLTPYNKIEKKSAGKNIVMIGSGNRLNREGLTWFLDEVWEKLKHYDTDIQFLIAGSICNVIEERTEDERIQIYGLFESPEEIYTQGDLFINPMQGGTGLKIKTFEALANGKYVISTMAGATGLEEFAGNGLFCSDSPAEWMHRILSFFDEEKHSRDKELGRARNLVTNIYAKNLEVISSSLKIHAEGN